MTQNRPTEAQLKEVAELARAIGIPQDRRYIRPFIDFRQYHSKMRYVVGYAWSRPGSHYLTGFVYDQNIGYGDSIEDAIQKARQKLENQLL